MYQERVVTAANGWPMVFVNFILVLLVPLCIIGGATRLDGPSASPAVGVPLMIGGALILACAILCTKGFFILLPNEAAVLTLFGRYTGSVKAYGFWWVNPFSVKRKVSLRSYNLNGDKLKVNDKAGNPIEIAAVVVWKVQDTFAACFDVVNYADFVKVQSESAIRHLASTYPYDSWEEGDEHAISLRANIDEVSSALEKELQERLTKAGVKVEEARLSHLAYSAEIAGAMLQRQQASAIIAARRKIVEGAVGMVQMALAKLGEEHVVTLDEERKAAMVSNLLVVLCGNRDPHPVVNTGSLY
jgi:regulator of protease activity HflC (stomatin/prohibitin superfamily)